MKEDSPWYSPVGKFMLAFGDIEHSSISLLGCLPACNIPKSAAKLPLGVRIDLLREVLPRYEAPEYQEVLKRLNEVSSKAPMRNFVAHNAVWIDLYQKDDDIYITNFLVSARDRTKRLTLEEMDELAESVHELAKRFSEATVEVLRLHVDDPDI